MWHLGKRRKSNEEVFFSPVWVTFKYGLLYHCFGVGPQSHFWVFFRCFEFWGFLALWDPSTTLVLAGNARNCLILPDNAWRWRFCKRSWKCPTLPCSGIGEGIACWDGVHWCLRFATGHILTTKSISPLQVGACSSETPPKVIYQEVHRWNSLDRRAQRQHVREIERDIEREKKKERKKEKEIKRERDREKREMGIYIYIYIDREMETWARERERERERAGLAAREEFIDPLLLLTCNPCVENDAKTKNMSR